MSVVDPGLQPERTLLAWRRTSLAWGVASAAFVRFATESLGLIAVVVGVAGVALAVAAALIAGSRYRRGMQSLLGLRAMTSNALPMALLSAAGVVVGVGCLAFVVGGL